MPDSGDRLPGPAARASPWRRRGAVRPPKRCCSIGHVVLLLVGVTVGLAVGYGVQLYALDGIRSLSAHAGAAAPATVALPHRRAFLAVTQPDVGRGTACIAAGRRDLAPWTDGLIRLAACCRFAACR